MSSLVCLPGSRAEMVSLGGPGVPLPLPAAGPSCGAFSDSAIGRGPRSCSRSSWGQSVPGLDLKIQLELGEPQDPPCCTPTLPSCAPAC